MSNLYDFEYIVSFLIAGMKCYHSYKLISTLDLIKKSKKIEIYS